MRIIHAFLLKSFLLIIMIVQAGEIQAQQNSREGMNIVVIFAHPDDAESRMGATASMMAQAGHNVKFVAITNGNAGHQELGGGILGSIRRGEAEEAARRLGIDQYVVMDNNDGELLPEVHIRMDVIREIRNWDADVVFGLRPWDYHPDHRYAGVLVQDAAYMVGVPNLVSDTPALEHNPVFFYMSDGFQKPNPFQHDVVVGIDSHLETKVRGLDAHVSQMYEWLPWIGGYLDQVPASGEDRLEWMTGRQGNVSDEQRQGLVKWYGEDRAARFSHAESFEICEYGRRPTEELIRQIFPMLPGN